ncbi:MAG: ATP-binding protein [Armatimonadota bacterium]|nr:ATP-binding protein [Armatimonadota bacterium]MCX7778237.1 ATP-binding protein [Armatimonadota bacterium]MDW8024952.1 ATP-binding protein [Armatimonadota bacterium]
MAEAKYTVKELLISEAEEMRREQSSPYRPLAPASIDETGLKESFIAELILKTLYTRGTMLSGELSEVVKLPYFNIVQNVLSRLRHEELVEVRRGISRFETQWELGLTSKGIHRAREIFEYNGYVGPAPVPLSHYVQQMQYNRTQWSGITDSLLRQVLSDLVINERLLRKLGPAFNSGRSLFLYGNPGNGKTSIAERLARAMGGTIVIPYAIEVHGQVIRYFDPAYHEPVELEETDKARRVGEQQFDQRWVVCKQPFIVVGGELKLEHLELHYDRSLKFYTAPVQMKANGGAFMIDDFGRQQVPPKDLLNRWIVPLEKQVDFHTLITGEQICVPFYVLIIFSTNLNPKELVEEAFLRRIRYKIEVSDPTQEEFVEIFKRVCVAVGVEYDQTIVDYLLEKHYRQVGRGLRAVHPRDLMLQLIDYCNYMGIQPKLTKELIDIVCETYFVEL